MKNTLNHLREILNSFEALLSQDSSEETLKQFLKENPLLIDPTAKEIRVEHPLGSEYRIDFVVIHESDVGLLYTLVELEKATCRLFTQAEEELTRELRHAIQQVEDWQEWIEENISYAERTGLAGIRLPRGVIVIGRSLTLTEKMRRRLRRKNLHSGGRLTIMTYDGLLLACKNLLNNLELPYEA